MASKGAVKDFAVKIQTSTARTVFAYWSWDEPHTAGFRVIWSYSTGQYSEARKSVVYFTDSDNTVKTKTSVYNAPSNATQVQVRVLPVAETKGDNKTPYWTASWSPTKYLTFAKTIGRHIPKSEYKITGFSIIKQAGTDRTLYASWTWHNNKNQIVEHTDYYKVDVDYQTTDKKWYNGEDTVTDNRNINYYMYNAPANAIAVRCRVQPIATSYIDGDFESPYWTADWSAFKTYTFQKTAAEIAQETTDKLQNKPTGIKFNIQNGTSRTVYVVWSWDKANTDHYEVAWEYATGNGVWFAGSTDTSVTKKNALYSAPDNAVSVRCRIRAISTARKSNDVKYWTAPWSDWKSYTIPKEPPDIEGSTTKPAKTNAVPTNIKFNIQKGTDRTVYATWEWSKTNTKHYEYAWQYTTGQTQIDSKTKKKTYTWFAGSGTQTTDSASIKNATYSAPDNAVAVRFRIKAVSNTRTGTDVQFWTADYTSWMVYSIPKNNDPSAPTVKNLTTTATKVSVKKQAGTDRTVYATWAWTQSNTDYYEYEFEYKAGSTWFNGTTAATSTNTKQSGLYSVPDNAVSVRFRVKPVSKTRQYSNAEYHYWISKYTSWVYWDCPSPVAKAKTNTVRNVEIGMQAGSDSIAYATWDWTGTLKGVYEADKTTLKELTKEYKVIWRFKTSNDGPWFDGSEGTVSRKLSTYSVPSNAKKVYIKVQPIAKTHKVNGKEVAYWTAPWCSAVVFNIPTEEESVDKTPAEPTAPTVTIENLKLRAELSTYDTNTKLVEFEVIKVPATGNTSRHKLVRVKVDRNSAVATVPVNTGCFYKVHARGIRPTKSGAADTLLSNTTSSKDAEFGVWSQYSSVVGTQPAAPSKITKHTVMPPDSLRLDWSASSMATGYEIEYATNKDYFDVTDQTTKVTQDNTETHHIFVGLDGGKYFFRVRATNESGTSGWTDIYAAVMGTVPSAPTTWSETTTALLTEAINFYWMHNSEDGSSQTAAQVQLTIDGVTTTVSPTKLSTDDTSSYYTFTPTISSGSDILDESGETILDESDGSILDYVVSDIPEGTVVKWRVRTKGVLDAWSPWSVQRSVIFYAPPTIAINIENDPNSDYKMQTVRSYPLYVRGSAWPASQKVIGYSISILAGEAYSTQSEDGTEKFVSEGEVVYSKYLSSEKGSENTLLHKITAGDVGLTDDMPYILNVTASFDTGLTAEDTYLFRVSWDDTELLPNAEVQFDNDLYCAYIHPYCVDEDGELIDDITLSVYRREYDGSFTLIADDIDNGDATSVTDPHPALDYARYRIVAMSKDSGNIGYYDVPGIPVGITSIIIQWDDAWSNLNLEDDAVMETNTWTSEPVWKGSLLKFPYNIGVSADYGMDVALIEYIGRKHPVSYYGTQLGETGSWTADIPRNDAETLYQLRRLAIYPGNCYVREPSGSGYWAQVTPSFSRSYDNMLIPVTLNITRVEGGA